jgi:carbamoyl-phosphate synthase small subunit
VQYHPEAAAGPHDADALFDRFREMVLAERSRDTAAPIAVDTTTTDGAA